MNLFDFFVEIFKNFVRGGTSDPYIKMKWPEGLENKTSVVQKSNIFMGMFRF